MTAGSAAAEALDAGADQLTRRIDSGWASPSADDNRIAKFSCDLPPHGPANLGNARWSATTPTPTTAASHTRQVPSGLTARTTAV
jgi:hypothetical protein